MTASTKILIAGLGDVGKQLFDLLSKQDFEVWGACRSQPEAPYLKTWCQVDLGNPDTFSNLPKTIDAVVYLPTPDERSEQAYRRIFLTAQQALFRHYRRCKPAWLFVSSTSVYGQRAGEWVDEDSVTEPINFSGKVIKEAEQWLLEQRVSTCHADSDTASGDAASDIKVKNTPVIARFTGLYGKGRKRLINRVLSHKPVQQIPPCYTNRIHTHDGARMLAFLLQKQQAGEELYHCYLGVDDLPATEDEVYQWLADQMGQPPLPVENHQKSDQNKRCSNQRIKALGFQFQYPTFKEGYSGLLEDINTHC